MKLIILFLLTISHLEAQTKLNTKKEVDILFERNEFSLNKIFDGNTPYIFKLVNNTDYTYIIDPYGFKSDNFVMTIEGNIITPVRIVLNGFYKRFDSQECVDDLIILGPKEKKYVSLSIVNLNGVYDLDKHKKYIIKLHSHHNKYTASLLGCQDYIESLISSKKYKVFDDSIDTTVSLVP
ncbi:hypothetical protein FY557_10045 [Chryseobacterium sp. SN22]|uniref:hypothetical protein n=1 Tax=Chryseobacterium sp. SN22 TaxID=2606431 RepID=UPI0011EC1026|nr:hypothetical protein [Chryseobacterium sp. SN22]KAA0128053.1 hypothetical protein FY557_10045 [Chryseobacterium sp. SN22]